MKRLPPNTCVTEYGELVPCPEVRRRFILKEAGKLRGRLRPPVYTRPGGRTPTLIPPPMPSMPPAAEAASWGRMVARVGKPAAPTPQKPPKRASFSVQKGPRMLAIPGKRGICCRGDIVQCTVRNGYGRSRGGLEGLAAILSNELSRRGERVSVRLVTTPDTNMFDILRAAAKPVGGSTSAVRERARSTYYIKRNGREFWDFNY